MLWSPAWHQRSIRGYRMKHIYINVQHRSQSPTKFKPSELLEASEKTSWHHKIPEKIVMQYLMQHANTKKGDHQFVSDYIDLFLSHWYLGCTHSQDISAKSIHKIINKRRGWPSIKFQVHTINPTSTHRTSYCRCSWSICFSRAA